MDAGLEFMRANKKNSDAYQLVNTGNPRDDLQQDISIAITVKS